MRRHVPILVRHRDRISDAEGQTQEQAGARASIGVNRSMFQPHWKKILERYLLKFSKGGKVHADEANQRDARLSSSEALQNLSPFCRRWRPAQDTGDRASAEAGITHLNRKMVGGKKLKVEFLDE